MKIDGKWYPDSANFKSYIYFNSLMYDNPSLYNDALDTTNNIIKNLTIVPDNDNETNEKIKEYIRMIGHAADVAKNNEIRWMNAIIEKSTSIPQKGKAQLFLENLFGKDCPNGQRITNSISYTKLIGYLNKLFLSNEWIANNIAEQQDRINNLSELVRKAESIRNQQKNTHKKLDPDIKDVSETYGETNNFVPNLIKILKDDKTSSGGIEKISSETLMQSFAKEFSKNILNILKDRKRMEEIIQPYTVDDKGTLGNQIYTDDTEAVKNFIIMQVAQDVVSAGITCPESQKKLKIFIDAQLDNEFITRADTLWKSNASHTFNAGKDQKGAGYYANFIESLEGFDDSFFKFLQSYNMANKNANNEWEITDTEIKRIQENIDRLKQLEYNYNNSIALRTAGQKENEHSTYKVKRRKNGTITLTKQETTKMDKNGKTYSKKVSKQQEQDLKKTISSYKAALSNRIYNVVSNEIDTIINDSSTSTGVYETIVEILKQNLSINVNHSNVAELATGAGILNMTINAKGKVKLNQTGHKNMKDDVKISTYFNEKIPKLNDNLFNHFQLINDTIDTFMNKITLDIPNSYKTQVDTKKYDNTVQQNKAAYEQGIKDFIELIKQEKDGQIALEQLKKEVKNIFDVSISTKDYTNYVDKYGFKGGSLGGNGLAAPVINNIVEMYRQGGITQVDAELLTIAAYNASSSTMVGYDAKDAIETYLLGGAAAFMFDDGWKTFNDLVQKQAEEEEWLQYTPTSIHLYFLNGMYYPESFILSCVYENLVDFYELVDAKFTQDKLIKGNRNKVEITSDLNLQTLNTMDSIGESKWNEVMNKAKSSTHITFYFLSGLLEIFNELKAAFNDFKLPS